MEDQMIHVFFADYDHGIMLGEAHVSPTQYLCIQKQAHKCLDLTDVALVARDDGRLVEVRDGVSYWNTLGEFKEYLEERRKNRNRSYTNG